jgi:adenylate cyclase
MALHAGEVVCGEIGDDGNRAFGVVGDAVHVARRMLDEAQLRSAPLLVSAAAAEQLNGAGDLVEQETFLPRGREAPVGLWALRA